MRIFFRRPMCVGCFCFMLMLILSTFFGVIVKLILAAFFALLFALVLLLLKPVQNQQKLNKLMICVATFMTVLSLIVSTLHFDLYLGRRTAFESENQSVEAVVIREVAREDYISVYEIQIRKVGGESYHIGGIIEFSSNVELHAGDVVDARGQLLTVENYLEDEKYKSAYYSDGKYMALICYNYQDCVVKEEKSMYPTVVFSEINRSVSGFLQERICGESGALSSALLLGNDEILADTTVRDFRRSGVSHILALSGMHVMVIAGFLDLVLKKLHFYKSARCCLMCVLLVLYLCVTGFSLSTVRAVLMLGFVYLAYFRRGLPDPLTNLFLSVTMIFILSPDSIYDAGMWLSFLSVFGLVTIYPCYEKGIVRILNPISSFKPIYHIFKFVLLSLGVTLAVNVCIVLVMSMLFGAVSYMTPIANLFMPLLATALLIISILVLLFGRIPFLSGVLSFLAEKTGELLISVAGHISHYDNVMLSLRHGFAQIILITMTAGILLCLLIDLKKHKYLIAVIPLTATLLLSTCFFVRGFNATDRLDVQYIRNGESEMLSVASGDEYAVIDISNGGYKNLSLAYDAISSFHGYEIDSYVVTHYHMLSASNLKRLSNNTIIRTVYLPIPINSEEEGVMNTIVRYLSESDIKIKYYASDDKIDFIDGATLDFVGREYIKRSEHPILAFSVRFGGDELLYLGESFSEASFCESLPSDSEHIIFGTHGPIRKREYKLSAVVGTGTSSIVFATDGIFEGVDYENKSIYEALRGCDLSRNVESKQFALFRKNEQ